MLYTLSKHAFALSLLHAAAFRCYQGKETVYKAAWVFGLTSISEREYAAEAFVQIGIMFYESATDWQKKKCLYTNHTHACAPLCAVINTVSSNAWASERAVDALKRNVIAPYFSSSTLTIAEQGMSCMTNSAIKMSWSCTVYCHIHTSRFPVQSLKKSKGKRWFFELSDPFRMHDLTGARDWCRVATWQWMVLDPNPRCTILDSVLSSNYNFL